MATSKDQIQAAFPEHNPNPVLSFDTAGKLTSANKSVTDLAKALGVEALDEKQFARLLGQE